MADLKVVVGDDWQPKLLPYFSMALMALMLVTHILNYKTLNVAGLPIMASIVTYVFSLILTDILTEVYGYRRVRRLLYIGLAGLAFYGACVAIAVWLPPAANYKNDAAFHAIFGRAPRIVLANIASYFATELTNSFIMSRLKTRLHGRHFMGRALAAVAGGQLVDCVVFFSIAFIGVMPLHDLLITSGTVWLIVMGSETLILPLTRQLAQMVKQAEGVEHFDMAPKGLAL